MRKIKSFPVEKHEEANKFMAENPPRSTDKQSGIIFHNGHIVIIYDDGVECEVDKQGHLKTLLEGERAKLWLVEHKSEVARIALKDIAPKGYVKGMSTTQIKKLVEETGAPYEKVQSIVAQIENAENTLLMDEHEVRRLGYEIKAYENLLKKK